MKLLTIDEAAEMLSVSKTTIMTMLDRLGAVDLTQGKAKKRLIRIPVASLDKYIRECAICSQAEPVTASRPWRIERRRA